MRFYLEIPQRVVLVGRAAAVVLVVAVWSLSGVLVGARPAYPQAAHAPPGEPWYTGIELLEVAEQDGHRLNALGALYAAARASAPVPETPPQPSPGLAPEAAPEPGPVAAPVFAVGQTPALASPSGGE